MPSIDKLSISIKTTYLHFTFDLRMKQSEQPKDIFIYNPSHIPKNGDFVCFDHADFDCEWFHENMAQVYLNSISYSLESVIYLFIVMLPEDYLNR